MGMIVDKCCCFELKTGTYIISILSLIFTIYMLIASGLGIGALEGICASHDCSGAEITVARVMLYILIVLFLVYLVLCALLIHGTRVENPKLMFPWIVWSIVNCVMTAINVILKFVGGAWLDGISQLVGLALTIYFVIVVRSHYYNLKNGTSPATAKV